MVCHVRVFKVSEVDLYTRSLSKSYYKVVPDDSSLDSYDQEFGSLKLALAYAARLNSVINSTQNLSDSSASD